MEGITLGNIAVALALIAGIITSVSAIAKHFKKLIEKTLSSQFEDLKKGQKETLDKINEVDREACKNYLVVFLSGVEKGAAVDEIERERFYEEFAHYKKIGGNSYIARKVEPLHGEGKL